MRVPSNAARAACEGPEPRAARPGPPLSTIAETPEIRAASPDARAASSEIGVDVVETRPRWEADGYDSRRHGRTLLIDLRGDRGESRRVKVRAGRLARLRLDERPEAYLSVRRLDAAAGARDVGVEAMRIPYDGRARLIACDDVRFVDRVAYGPHVGTPATRLLYGHDAFDGLSVARGDGAGGVRRVHTGRGRAERAARLDPPLAAPADPLPAARRSSIEASLEAFRRERRLARRAASPASSEPASPSFSVAEARARYLRERAEASRADASCSSRAAPERALP